MSCANRSRGRSLDLQTHNPIEHSLKVISVLLIPSMVPSAPPTQIIPPFLSNLHATKNDPLYTTSVAAMERSEFTLEMI
jgi:hypothetical protein